MRYVLPESGHFHILGTVTIHFLKPTRLRFYVSGSIPEFTFRKIVRTGLILIIASVSPLLSMADDHQDSAQREAFTKAWRAAAEGNRAEYRRLMPGLRDYLLYPYLEYEDFRERRGTVNAEEMASFLESHEDWAFTDGLRKAWLRTLGKRKQWDSLLAYGSGSSDTEVQCYLAQARIKRGQTEGLVPVARALWAVGKSQPDACDPVFAWLKKQGGITPALAWERIRRAMEQRQPRLILYLARYLEEADRVWVDRWYQQDRSGYRRLEQARTWGDQEKSREITSYGLRRLARSDSDRAWRTYQTIESRFSWPEEVRGSILREIALWSAVESADETPQRMQNVPERDRDGKLLEWWARFSLSRADWEGLARIIARMPEEQKNDTKWRYWDARALIETGEPARAQQLLAELALDASYFGFLSADELNLPYTICPVTPEVDPARVSALRGQAGFRRAIELRKAGITNWSRSEWQTATRNLDTAGLRVAAALAVEEGWADLAIFALGNSGDRKWYAWRFPIAYAATVESQASKQKLDPAWVLGLMRSESAMAEDALSPAGAMGLMQIMPNTARQLARRHSISYAGPQQLNQATENIEMGTTYLRELLDRFNDNEMLATGSYNAGPNAVERWLKDRHTDDPSVWLETLPYFETRDYIPRVLAFSTIYDWRLEKPVSRVSSRMPEFNSATSSGNMRVRSTAEVICRTSG